jgi:hypothetical protein
MNFDIVLFLFGLATGHILSKKRKGIKNYTPCRRQPCPISPPPSINRRNSYRVMFWGVIAGKYIRKTIYRTMAGEISILIKRNDIAVNNIEIRFRLGDCQEHTLNTSRFKINRRYSRPAEGAVPLNSRQRKWLIELSILIKPEEFSPNMHRYRIRDKRKPISSNH